MADSKHNRKEDVCSGRVSAESGSESVFEQICQPCSRSTEKVFEAIGFCIDCQEWLCKTCYKYHRRPTPVRDHHLMNMEQMKSNMPPSRRKDKCTKTCDLHEGKKLKYFCSQHDSFGCSMCVFQDHRGCCMDSIPELAQDIFTRSEFTNLIDRFKDVTNTAKVIEIEVKKHIAQTARKHVEAKDAIKTFTKQLNDAVGEIKTDLENQCSSHQEVEMKKHQSTNEKCQTLETQAHAITSQIDTLKERNRTCDAYVIMKRAASRIKPLEDEVKETRSSITSSSYIFKPNIEVLQTLKSPGGMGTLTSDIQYDKQDYSNIKAEHVCDISLGSNCRITGSAVLSPNRLVLVDSKHEMIMVMDPYQDRLISEITVNGCPWSIAIMNRTTFAVTFPEKHTILIVRMLSAGELSKDYKLIVSGRCLGISYYDNTFIVSFRSPEKIEVVHTMTGTVLRTLAVNEEGQSQLLSIPQHVVLSANKKSMFVSNLYNNTIVRMRLDGTVVGKYQDDRLKGPEQAAVDENGMLFVAAYYSNNVHLITPNCKKGKVILTEADGLKCILSISYCALQHRLYIGMDKCDKIIVFELK